MTRVVKSAKGAAKVEAALLHAYYEGVDVGLEVGGVGDVDGGHVVVAYEVVCSEELASGCARPFEESDVESVVGGVPWSGEGVSMRGGE